MSEGPFSAVEARGLVSEAISDVAILRAMLRFEAALAAAEAEAGLIPAAHAVAIADVCRGALPNAVDLGREAAESGAPVVPLLAELRHRLGGEAAASLHHGATTQDVVDSAVMLVTAGALRAIENDLVAAADRVRSLADAHRRTPALGRTLLQPARATTFGARAVVWLGGLDAAVQRLAWARSHRVALQLGGPVGTLDAFGADAEAVRRGVAARLGLQEPAAAWHAERSRIADLAGALGTAAAAAESVAVDLVLLAQAEIAEVRDARAEQGQSSSMAHKRNPIAAVLVRAAAMQAPGLVATLLAAAGAGELERASGAWHAEWRAMRELLRAAGTAAAWLREALEHLELDPARMAANLELAGDIGRVEPAVAAGERLVASVLAGRRPRPPAEPVRLARTVDGQGDGPTIVLAGSLGSTLAMWEALVALLGGRFRVVRCDLRGHGDSPTPPAPYVIDDLGDDLVALLDDLGLARGHLVGTSIGGMAAMAAAAGHPDRVDRLVVIGASARFPDRQPWVDRARRVLAEGSGSVAAQVVAGWTTPAWAAAHEPQLAEMHAMFERADPAGYAGCCLALAAMDLRPRLADIRAPTLVLCGRDDPATPPEHSQAIAGGIPGARLELLAGAAHLPSIERPETVAELISAHLLASREEDR
jgi:3-carboxy-cis,cis-muconate cycloisomerase